MAFCVFVGKEKVCVFETQNYTPAIVGGEHNLDWAARGR
jgi:hypothetical protein